MEAQDIFENIAMDKTSPRSIVLDFIKNVNQGNLIEVNAAISEDVISIDILGRVYQEREFMENYLINYPQYKIHVDNALRGGNGVAIIGHTSGSHVLSEIEKNETLVWTAEIEDGLISEWRIYASDEYAGLS